MIWIVAAGAWAVDYGVLDTPSFVMGFIGFIFGTCLSIVLQR